MVMEKESNAGAAVTAEAQSGIDYTGKKIGMWLFLFTELLFFGGYVPALLGLSVKYPAEFHSAAQEENLLLGS